MFNKILDLFIDSLVASTSKVWGAVYLKRGVWGSGVINVCFIQQ